MNISYQIFDTVLVVDDTVANHDVIRTFLNDIDVRCESAYDGMEAITLCSGPHKKEYSLILMDINLPHMNGFEVTEKLRLAGVTTPVIAVTAACKNDHKIEDSHSTFNALLFKPFNASEFFAAISPYIKNALSYSLPPECIPKDENDLPRIDPRICNIQKAIANMGSSPRLFAKHFNNFKTNNVDLSLRLEMLLCENQFEDCRLLCHSIKGLAGMLALTDLYEHIIQIESLLHKIDALPESAEDRSAQEAALVQEAKNLLPAVEEDIRLVCKVQF